MAKTEIDPEQEPLLPDTARPQGLPSTSTSGQSSRQPPPEDDLEALAPPPFGFAALVFRLVSTATVVSALGCCCSVALMGVASAQLTWANMWTVALESYAALLAVIAALLEIGASGPSITSRCPVLEPWVGRAFLQFLVAVLTHTEVTLQLTRLPSDAGGAGGPPPAAAPSPAAGGGAASSTVLGIGVFLGNASAIALTACALVHLVGGLLCAGQIKEYVMDRRRQHLQLLQDLKDLEQKRASLRRGAV